MSARVGVEERPSPDAMTLIEHLAELRHRLLFCAVAFVAGAIATYALYTPLLHFLTGPLYRAAHNRRLYVTGPLEGFGVRLDVTAYGGAVLALPVIVYELWRFVTPGLLAHEKRFALPFVFATIGLFCLGAFVAWTTFPHALGFLRAVGGPRREWNNLSETSPAENPPRIPKMQRNQPQ